MRNFSLSILAAIFVMLALTGVVMADLTDPTSSLCPFPITRTTILGQSCTESWQVAGISSGTMVANEAVTYQEGNNQTSQVNSYHSSMVGIGPMQYASLVSFQNSDISTDKAIISGNSVGMQESYAQSNMNYSGIQYNDQSAGGTDAAFSGGYVSNLTLTNPINSQFSVAMANLDGSPDSGFGAVWQSVKGVEGFGGQVFATQESSMYNAYSGDQFTFAASLGTRIGHPFAGSSIGASSGTLSASRLPLCGTGLV